VLPPSRGQIFLRARNAPLDLRGMTLPLLKRKQQLTKNTAPRAKEVARRPSYDLRVGHLLYPDIASPIG
jgi:hypothetical protein